MSHRTIKASHGYAIIHSQIKNSKDIGLAISFSIVILTIGIVKQDVYFGVLLLPLFLVFIIIQIRLNSFNTEKNLIIDRKFSKHREAEEGEIKVSILVSNESSTKTQLLELTDEVPPSFEIIEGTNVFLFNLKANETITLHYKIQAKQTGIYDFGKIRVRHMEYFKLSIHSMVYELSSNDRIIISPKFERINKLPIYSYWMNYLNGFFVSKQFGQDSDFKGIREYQSGDKFNRLNWKVSAKYQAGGSQVLYSNNFSFDNILEFELVFDLSYESFLSYNEGMRALATITDFLIRTRNKVGLTIAKDFPDRIRPKAGSRQYSIIIDKLLIIKPDVKKNTSLLKERLLNVSRFYAKNSIVIFVSSLLNESLVDYCRQLKERNSNIIVLHLNTIAKQLELTENDREIMKIAKNQPLFYNLIALDLLYKKQKLKEKIIEKQIPLLEWNLASKLDRIFQNTNLVIK